MAQKKVTQPVINSPSPSGFRWFFGHIFSLARKQGGLLVICGTVIWCAREFAKVAIAYAGATSFADITVKVLASIQTVWTLSISVSGISIALYWRERSLDRKTRERLTRRITELEIKIDPSRTSSKLTSEGLTRKEDE
jgi:hypothetical protein